MLELDILLQAYVERRYARAPQGQQQAFVALLNYPDQMLYEYLLGHSRPSDPGMAHVVQEILAAAQD